MDEETLREKIEKHQEALAKLNERLERVIKKKSNSVPAKKHVKKSKHAAAFKDGAKPKKPETSKTKAPKPPKGGLAQGATGAPVAGKRMKQVCRLTL